MNTFDMFIFLIYSTFTSALQARYLCMTATESAYVLMEERITGEIFVIFYDNKHIFLLVNIYENAIQEEYNV